MRVLTDVTEASWHTIVDRNFTAVWLASAVAQEAVRDGGAIINVASTGGLSMGSPGHGVYTAAKAAVIHLTRTLALECAPRRIRVNALAPGHTRTDDYDTASGFTDEKYAKLGHQAAARPAGARCRLRGGGGVPGLGGVVVGDRAGPGRQRHALTNRGRDRLGWLRSSPDARARP